MEERPAHKEKPAAEKTAASTAGHTADEGETGKQGTKSFGPEAALLLRTAADRVLERPGTETLDAFSKAFAASIKQDRAAHKAAIKEGCRVFLTNLPSYTIHTKGYKYCRGNETENYEHNLMGEWQKYLRIVIGSRKDECFKAAALLLPQTLLFNKSDKLISKVIRGTVHGSEKIRKRSLRAIKKTFRGDVLGNKARKVLEVMASISLGTSYRKSSLLSPRLVKQLSTVPVFATQRRMCEERRQEQKRGAAEEGARGSSHRKKVNAQAGTASLRKEVEKELEMLDVNPSRRMVAKNTKSVADRILKIYLKILREGEAHKYYFILRHFEEVAAFVHPTLYEGVYLMLAGELQRERGVYYAAHVSLAMFSVFGDRVTDYSPLLASYTQAPLAALSSVAEKKIAFVYEAVSRIFVEGGVFPEHQLLVAFIQKVVQRAVYQMDCRGAELVKKLMRKFSVGPAALVGEPSIPSSAFWEFRLVTKGPSPNHNHNHNHNPALPGNK